MFLSTIWVVLYRTTTFRNHSSLSYLDLSYNPALVLNLSANWTPPFQLDFLALATNKIGPNFPKWLITQQNLTHLDISDARICDTIPKYFWTSISSSPLFYLNMSNNMIHGVLPNLSITFQRLDYFVGLKIDMSSNNLSGAIPSFLRNEVSVLRLNNNKLSEGLFQFLCPKTSKILMYLDLSNNLFYEALPECWNDCFFLLKVLNLQNNNISGNLPSSMASLVDLQALHLRNNSLYGELPMSWMHSTSFIMLTVLDLGDNLLSGYIPSTFGHGFEILETLSLRNNKLSMRIPSSLCKLSCLQILDLSGNHISGTLPNCLYNLQAMTNKSYFADKCKIKSYISPDWLIDDMGWFMWKGKEYSIADYRGLLKGIDIANNNLQGQIPDKISSLVGLVFLNLSQNNLSGPIPTRIGQLTSLEFLDLSNNHLSGEIPTSLASISYLELLDLLKNNLTGKIPVLNYKGLMLHHIWETLDFVETPFLNVPEMK